MGPTAPQDVSREGQAVRARDSLRLLLPHVRINRARLAAAAVCLGASAAGVTTLPWLFSLAIDSLNGSAAGTVASAGAGASRWAYAGLFVALTALSAGFRYQARMLLLAVGVRMETALRRDLFAHLTSVPVRHHGPLRAGDLITRLTSDVSTGCSMLELFWVAAQLLTCAGALTMMASISPSLLIGAVLPLAVVPFIVHRKEQEIRALMHDAGRQYALLTSLTQESIVSARAIRAYVAESYEVERFRLANEAHEHAHLRVSRAFATLNLISQTLCGAAAVIVLWLGAAAVMTNAIAFAAFIAFFGYFAVVQSSVLGLGSIVNQVEGSLAALTRLSAIFELPAERRERADDEPAPLSVQDAPRYGGGIEVRDLSFSYDTTKVLDRVRLRIPAGTSVAIVGPNGSGKSTLAALLLRVLEPPRGTIYIDGVDVRDWPLSSLRRFVALAPEEAQLFSGTIADNIAFGRTEGDIESDSPLRVAALDRDVAGLPEGLKTAIGERGTRLSGGQRQRVALARALAIEPRILILDGALSAVDARTQRAITTSLRQSARTTIVITSTVSIARAADHVILLHDGRVVDQGRHEELMARSLVYLAAVRQEGLERDLSRSTDDAAEPDSDADPALDPDPDPDPDRQSETIA